MLTIWPNILYLHELQRQIQAAEGIHSASKRKRHTAGEAAGSKLTKANELGIPVHDEAWLLAQISYADAESAQESPKTEPPSQNEPVQTSLF